MWSPCSAADHWYGASSKRSSGSQPGAAWIGGTGGSPASSSSSRRHARVLLPRVIELPGTAEHVLGACRAPCAHDGGALARRVLTGEALHQLRMAILMLKLGRLHAHMHGVMPALVGFPAPRPPRAGEPRPSLSFVYSFVPRRGKFLVPDLFVVKVPGTAEHSARCVPARCARSCVPGCIHSGLAGSRQNAA